MATTQINLDIASRVPSNVWEQIFQHFSVLQLLEFRQICRGWRSTVDGCPALLKRIMLKFPEGITLGSEYKPKYMVPTRNLMLERVQILTVDTWWPTFAQRLVFLSINDCSISRSTLLQALKPMTNLKVLKFSKIKMEGDSGLAVIFEMKQVEQLTADDLIEENFCFLAPLFTQLKWIDLPRLYEAYEPGVSESILIDVLRSLKHTLEGITVDYSPALMDEILQLKQLTRLVMQTGDLNNLELMKIGTELTNLKSVQVNLSASIEIPTFLKTMPNVEEICLISERHTLDFSELKNPQLIRFKLCSIEPVYGSLLRYLEYSPKITDICLDDCRFHNDVEFAILELFCQTLQRLELRLLYVSSNDYTLSKTFNSLTYLKLDRCTMDETFLISLISRCPRLEEVHLESMSNFNDVVLLVLFQNLKHLEKLTLSCCPVTDFAADYIVEHFRALKKLTIRSDCFSRVAKEKLRKLSNLRCQFD